MIAAMVSTSVILLLASCDDSVSTSYATRAEAEADSLFDRGWLPDIVPPSIRAIEMTNDLDLNISNGDFRFDPGDYDAFVGRLLRSTTDDKDGLAAYNYEDWTFWISPDKSYCKFRMRLRRDK